MKMRTMQLGLVAVIAAGFAIPEIASSLVPKKRVVKKPALARSSIKRPPSAMQLVVLNTSRIEPPAAKLFSAKSWAITPPPKRAFSPPPPPVVILPPPVPEAPPLPFVFMGKMVEGNQTTLFLVDGERVHMVTEGAVIDNLYKLEKIELGQATLRYLPLETAHAQILTFGETR